MCYIMYSICVLLGYVLLYVLLYVYIICVSYYRYTCIYIYIYIERERDRETEREREKADQGPHDFLCTTVALAEASATEPEDRAKQWYHVLNIRPRAGGGAG